jgi:hypothetical protein
MLPLPAAGLRREATAGDRSTVQRPADTRTPPSLLESAVPRKTEEINDERSKPEQTSRDEHGPEIQAAVVGDGYEGAEGECAEQSVKQRPTTWESGLRFEAFTSRSRTNTTRRNEALLPRKQAPCPTRSFSQSALSSRRPA